MPTDSPVSLKNMRERRNNYAEVSDAEKRLWACIQSRGVFGTDVKDLYHKACSIYEKLFLNENELPDLQTIEYLLWRLHYKHIDEFRRRIAEGSVKEEDKLPTNQKMPTSWKSTSDAQVEGFKLFLSEATKFYQDLIRKIKRYFGLVGEPWFYKNDRVSGLVEQTKLHKCQFVCHRLCICLGDLARYLELYWKPCSQQRNWYYAANCYLEAAKIYPDGGNPQNQLALLATYIGDEFLALYHCIRSLAVKEPFPDALRNLLLLFERNRSSNIGSLSDEVYDFSKPSEWHLSSSKATADGNYSNSTALRAAKHDQYFPTDLWSLIIRMTSFFFLESSLDSFLCTVTSTIRELEALLALDVVKLSSALESYQKMNLSKVGPCRGLHLISVLIFIIHNLNEEPERRILKPTDEMLQSMLVKLALTITFVCMGRFVDRCLKGSPTIYFPLLPSLLVFVEWLVGYLDKVDAKDENCESAMGYFFGSFIELLNYLLENTAEVAFPDHIALWEDYELSGFVPISHAHMSLDFSSHWEEEINYKMKNKYRAHRIIQAAMKIAKRSCNNARKWVFYDEEERKFSTMSLALEGKGPYKKINSGPSFAVEEEEDIVFKPITRHKSEPIPRDGQETASTSYDALHRACTLLLPQNQTLNDSSTSPSAVGSTSPCNQGQNESQLKGSLLSTSSEGSIAAGPPSLNSWVLNGERLSSERTKSSKVNKITLKPIEEMVSEDLGGLPHTKDKSSCISSSVQCPSTYCAPIFSDPLLPENAVLCAGVSPKFPPNNTKIHETARFVPASRLCVSAHPSNVHKTGPGVTNPVDHSAPFLVHMGSYPWSGAQPPKLVNHDLQLSHNHVMQEQYYAPRNISGVYGSEGFSDGWSYCNPLASVPTFCLEGSPSLQPSSSLFRGLGDQRTNMPFQDYLRASPYESGAVSGTRPEPQPLLQYLKHREWQLQQQPQFTGSPYMQH